MSPEEYAEHERLTAEVKQLRVAADPRAADTVRDLVQSVTRLVRIERDDARQRAERAEAAIERALATFTAHWKTDHIRPNPACDACCMGLTLSRADTDADGLNAGR